MFYTPVRRGVAGRCELEGGNLINYWSGTREGSERGEGGDRRLLVEMVCFVAKALSRRGRRAFKRPVDYE